MIYKISKRLYDKCVKFSEDRLSGSKQCYSYRGESRLDKMKEDIVIGTLGEWAVMDHISSLGYNCSKPDMKIYDAKRKSFDADLFVDDDIEVHVKSQGVKSAKRYGNSWLLQKSDAIVKNPQENQIFAFTCVDLSKLEVEILGFCWAEDMKYSECRVWSYRKTKVAVYLPEIQENLVQFED